MIEFPVISWQNNLCQQCFILLLICRIFAVFILGTCLNRLRHFFECFISVRWYRNPIEIHQARVHWCDDGFVLLRSADKLLWKWNHGPLRGHDARARPLGASIFKTTLVAEIATKSVCSSCDRAVSVTRIRLSIYLYFY